MANLVIANKELWEQVKSSKDFRVKLAKSSYYWFFHIYFSEHAQYPTATFQKEIYTILENSKVKHAVIVAFRGSAKSTIASLAFPIWSILGEHNNKFVLIISQTQSLAKAHLLNIKRAFENNDLLRSDFGSCNEDSDEWGSTSLYLPKYNARISSASTDQSIRGIRHGAHRPDIIIADDVEDTNSVKTQEGRDRVFDWFVSEVIPAGDKNTRIINIGNLLHEDSLMMRLKSKILNESLRGIYREYPITDRDGNPQWSGKYPTVESIAEQKMKISDDITWFREYMLKIVSRDGQVINKDWIKFYKELPPINDECKYVGSVMGVDLAISTKDEADYTALIVVHIYGSDRSNWQYYIDSNFINKRLTFLGGVESIKSIYSTNLGSIKKVIVENNGFQESVVETLADSHIEVVGVRSNVDKRTRLTASSMLFEAGKVFLPATESANIIINQLLGFGVEKHDDICDAISIALNYAASKIKTIPSIAFTDNDGGTRIVNKIVFTD